MGLDSFYYDEDSPAFLGSVKKLSNTVWPSVRRKTIKKWLSTQTTHGLHRPVYRNFPRNHYHVIGIDHLWEADLIDVSNLKSANDGHTFLLAVIDVFSKYAFVSPLKSKAAGVIVRAFKNIIDNSTTKRQPKVLQSDKGKEFKNKYLREFLKSRGIRQQFPQTHSKHKAAVVERFNRTFQTLLHKYFTSQQVDGHATKRYINILPKLVHLYNHSVHRTIKMRPVDVNETNVKIVYENTHRKHRGEHAMDIYSQPIEVGDYVRIARRKPLFEPGYTANWSKQLFRVTNIIRKKPFFLYKNKDSDGHPIQEKFYLHEMQRFNK